MLSRAHLAAELNTLDETAVLKMKQLIRDTSNPPQSFHASNLNEIFAGLERFEGGVVRRMQVRF